MRLKAVIKISRRDTECEVVKWTELAQDHVGTNGTGFPDVTFENDLSGWLP
jgi:hypothetical protein